MAGFLEKHALWVFKPKDCSKKNNAQDTWVTKDARHVRLYHGEMCVGIK